MATYTIKETAPVVYAFAKANIKKPVMSVLPYVVICGMITAIVDRTHPFIGILAQLATVYFSMLYASNIHRAFLHGVPATGFDPFKPSKDDWRFIGMIFLITLIILLIPCAAFLIAFLLPSSPLTIIVPVISVLVAIWLAWRLSMVLPDRAIGGSMKLQESFALTRGLVWKMFLTPFAASWVMILACIGWLALAGLIGTGILYAAFPHPIDKSNPLPKLILYILLSPATIGMGFWWSTVSVATLSNYYLWMKQNRA